MTEYTFDSNIVSDLHKDAYGFRPTQGFWAQWEAMNDDGKQAEWDYLCDALYASNEEEELRQKRAIVEFEDLVNTTLAAGAADRATALRWIMGNSLVCDGDWSFLACMYGLPYNYFKV